MGGALCKQIKDQKVMAKKLKAVVTLQIPAGKANPAPPIGPALAQHGINLMGFCKEYNARTGSRIGEIVPAEISIFTDGSSQLSRPLTLTELGVSTDLLFAPSGTEVEDDGVSLDATTERWGWAALALGAAALALLAWWALADYPKRRSREEPQPSDQD